MESKMQRVAILAAGEPAMRLIDAVRELNSGGGPRITTIAFYPDPERHSLYVREADEAFGLGPATWTDPSDGSTRSAFLDMARLREALVATRADAAWVGWCCVSEQAEFAELCEELGVTFIGPTADTIRRLGDKISSKRVAEAAGVPVAPWSEGAVENLEEARVQGKRIGYPLMIKPTSGGGGRGIRKVGSDAELGAAFGSALAEAQRAFGDGAVFMEKLLTPAHHVEVQIIGDAHGEVRALGVRECSVQRRHRKLLDESPSPTLSPEEDSFLCDAAVRLGKAVGYRNAGTVEFLYEPGTKQFSFIEVNASLQVEHPVTEMVMGVDLVKLQLHVAAGGRLEGEPPSARGHAIEARLIAESPHDGFDPAPGVVQALRLPSGPGIRVDAGVAQGDATPMEAESVLAKVIAHGADRAEAIARLRRALYDTLLVIRGGESNKGFMLDLLGRPELVDGRVDVGWLDQLVLGDEHTTDERAEEAVVSAAILELADQEELERDRFYGLAARGRPHVNTEVGARLALGYGGSQTALHVRRLAPERYRIDTGGAELEVEVLSSSDCGMRLRCGGRAWRALSTGDGAVRTVEIDGIPYRVMNESGGMVRAVAPSVVVSINVEVGQRVRTGDRIAVVEAMKSETTIASPFSGVVREIVAIPNTQVGVGTPLVRMEVESSDKRRSVGDRKLDFGRLATGTPGADELTTLRSLVLGFDADPHPLKQTLTAHGTLTPGVEPEDARAWGIENEVVEAFADIAALFRREPHERNAQRESDTEYLHLYLHDIEGKGERLPPDFVAKLLDALAHYGVRSLEPTPTLRESLVRIYRARHISSALSMPILSILQRWCDEGEALQSLADEAFRERLGRFIDATDGRFQSLNDLAREVRYQYFERPLLNESRAQIYQEAERLLEATGNSSGPDRAAGVAWLVDCPQPLERFFERRFAESTPAVRGVMNEVTAKRYYRMRPLEELRLVEEGGVQFCLAEYEHEGERFSLVSTLIDEQHLDAALAAAAMLAHRCPAEFAFIADVHVGRPGRLLPEAEAVAKIRGELDALDFARPVHRVAVVTSGFGEDGRRSGQGQERGRAQYLTFRQGEGGEFVHDTRYPGLHPMIARRLQLWRLENFDLERLPSTEDVYLFLAVSRDNPKDERLYALAEVRDLTGVRNAAGRLLSVPNLERMLMEALSAIRVFQASRPPRRRLHWNRVRLFMWPVFTLSRTEVNELAHRLGPATGGLGIEKVEVSGRMPLASGEIGEARIEISPSGSEGLSLRHGPPPTEPLQPLSRYTQNVVRSRQRGLVYPYELIDILTPEEGVESEFPPGKWLEYDLDDSGERLVPVDRPPGMNTANVVAGVLTHFTDKVPEGMARVVLLGDPSRSMGSLAEQECRIINAAMTLAAEMKVPLEWIAVSAGARIAMDTGTENMDWISLTLRRIIEFTQAGHSLHVIVAGINVGAQPYWNAEATMLMHTKGVLIQTAQGALVLTGKRALDYSGGVSAEDNFGIGGYDHVMGPNGQAQYFARDLTHACRVLLGIYEHTYVVPGERFPRRGATTDPIDRDICLSPHQADGFATVGDVFSPLHNPARKKPFDIRRVMRATTDQDREPLERWRNMRDAETGVVWDAHVGGIPVCMIGMESRPIRRAGFVPADGPDHWTSGTLFPLSSKKIARAVNAASGNRPLVVLANLSGFDGSPESMRLCQLEFGAEIGRAVVNFDGPIVFTVVSRYHGGAFVVFSAMLNEGMEVTALEGTKASVIGGAPAAAVVFAREVEKRTMADGRIVELQSAIRDAAGAERVRLRTRLETVRPVVHSEKLGELADEFDSVHSVQRARDVGSVHRIIPPSELRPYVVDALERGMKRFLEGDEG